MTIPARNSHQAIKAAKLKRLLEGAPNLLGLPFDAQARLVSFSSEELTAAIACHVAARVAF